MISRESQAKEILDFLAKRVGYDELVFIVDSTIVLSRIRLEDVGNGRLKEAVQQSSLYVCRGPILNSIMSKFKSCIELLSDMFQMSSIGWDIQDKNGTVFLPSRATLEQILVEMDLKAGG